jgi:hypothetical protein
MILLNKKIMKDYETARGDDESFFQRLFKCCSDSERNDLEINTEEDTDRVISLKKSKMVFESENSLFPNNLILPEEKNLVKFTKEGLIEYITNLQNLVFPVIHEEDNIKISKRNYSDLNDHLPIFRCELTKHKLYFTDVPTIEQMVEAIRNPEQRRKWDKNLKEYKIVEKLKKESEVIRSVTNKQLSVIAEKEFYEKRVGIYENNVYYLFSSSVPANEYPNYTSFDRATNYISVMVIKEDDDNFYFDCINQIDAKINIPQEFIESNLLNKVNTFFDKYFEFLNILKQ